MITLFSSKIKIELNLAEFFLDLRILCLLEKIENYVALYEHTKDSFVPEEYIVQYFISRQGEQYNGERKTKEKAFVPFFVCIVAMCYNIGRQFI